MRRYRATAALPPADQRECQSAVTGVTDDRPLTCKVTGNANPAHGHGFAYHGTLGAVLAVAVTRPHLNPAVVVLVLIVAVVVWAVRAWLWPFAPCGRCDGGGKNIGSNGRRWGTCRKCKGSGRRQRLGSRLVRRLLSRRAGGSR